jgi:hypothetical protein
MPLPRHAQPSAASKSSVCDRPVAIAGTRQPESTKVSAKQEGVHTGFSLHHQTLLSESAKTVFSTSDGADSSGSCCKKQSGATVAWALVRYRTNRDEWRKSWKSSSRSHYGKGWLLHHYSRRDHDSASQTWRVLQRSSQCDI